MGTIQLKNNAFTTLAVGCTNVATTLTVTSSSSFPAVTTASGNWFYACLQDTFANMEIVKVTNVSGTTWTVTRGIGGTTSPAAGFASGSVVELRMTAETLTDITTYANITSLSDLTFSGTGNRIKGDFSNATIANRVLFQTTNIATGTIISAIPGASGGVASGLALYNSTDTVNNAQALLICNAGEVGLYSTKNGTGTYLPMAFYTSGAQQASLGTDGVFNVGQNRTAQFPAYGLYAAETTHATSRRAGIGIGVNWGLLQDTNGNGTKDFGFYDSAAGALRAVIKTTGEFSGMSVDALNGGHLAGFRNYLMNGDMRVAQRGSRVFSTSTSAYGGCDRWITSVTGTTVSGLALQVNLGGTGINGSYYAHQIGNVTTTGASSATISQRIEAINSLPLYGKTVTISGFVYQGSGSTQTLQLSVTKPNTGVDNWSSGQNALLAGVGIVSCPNTAWTLFTYTFNAGDTSLGMQINLGFTTGALTNAQFYFTTVQLEIGSYATPFERRPYSVEYALCQRYYQTVGFSYAGYGAAGQAVTHQYTLPVPTRINPAVATLVAPTYSNCSGLGVGTNAYDATQALPISVTVTALGAYSFTAGRISIDTDL